jgi:polysaccharide export outer membrane protein
MLKKIYVSLSIVLVTMLNSSLSLALPLSPGDRIEVSIPNEKYFTRTYEVNQNGELEIPYLGAITVVGLEPDEVKEVLTLALTSNNFFPPNTLQLSIQILKWAPILVSVSGEVFQPGRVLINQPDDPKISFTSPEANQITGEYQPKRYLTSAIEATGGVLPTANIHQIIFKRNGQERIIDLSGAFTGKPIEDIPLITGDEIIVPAANRFQPELVRPSLITPAGIKVIVSNLTEPASSNSTSAIGNDEEGIAFTYGARFSQAVIATNCVGGTQATNANRSAILVRTNRLTGETNYIERSVEDLLRNSHNNVDNPLLMPRDGVACYDSTVTNVRDVFQTFSQIINPFSLLRNLFDSQSK